MDEVPQISKPPLNLLVNPSPARSGKPWEVDIGDLLQKFITILHKNDVIDLRLCGVAALSSALLYRFKVESMFYFERLRVERAAAERADPPRMIILPFRYELYSTSLDDLVLSLERILQDVAVQDSRAKDRLKLIEPEPIVEIERFVVKIEQMVKEFKAKLMDRLKEMGTMLFSELVAEFSLQEKARSFILVLFVANEGFVSLEQEEDDIHIIRK